MEFPCLPEDRNPLDRHRDSDGAEQDGIEATHAFEGAARAFEQLWDLAHPHLVHSIRPPADRGTWPDLMPPRAPREQYKHFIQRLQSKWRTIVADWRSTGCDGQGWLQQDKISVMPVLAGLPPVNRGWFHAGRLLPRSVEILLSLMAGASWITSRDKLVTLRSSWALRARCRHPCVQHAGNPVRAGHLAGIRLRSKVRVIIVTDPMLRVNCLQLGQDLEQDRFFSDGGVWGVARLWHRTRRLGINESPAESWCGQLSKLWDPVQGPLTGPLVDRLRLCASGVKGNTLDDAVVDKVAATIKAQPFPERHPDKPELFKRRLKQVPSSWLHTSVGRSCVKAVRLTRATATSWLSSVKLAHKAYEAAELSQADIEALQMYERQGPVSLPDVCMTKPQRGVFARATASVRSRMRRELQEQAAMAQAKGKAEGKAKAKGKAKCKAQGKAKAEGTAQGKAKAEGKAEGKAKGKAQGKAKAKRRASPHPVKKINSRRVASRGSRSSTTSSDSSSSSSSASSASARA